MRLAGPSLFPSIRLHFVLNICTVQAVVQAEAACPLGGEALHQVAEVLRIPLEAVGDRQAADPHNHPGEAAAHQEALSLVVAVQEAVGHPLAAAVLAEEHRDQEVDPPAEAAHL